MDTPITSADPLAHDERDRSPRTSVMLRAHVFRVGDAEASEHRVVNVSETGLCIAQPTRVASGDIVVVSVGEVDHVPADVVWVRGGLAGLKFHEPVDLAAARRRSNRTGPALAPASGWMADLRSPYRGS